MFASVGDRIRFIRKTNRLSQTEFSALIGISQATLSELEKDKYNPSFETLMSIHKAFKTDLGWLITGDQDIEDKSNFLFNTSLDELELI